MVTPCLAHRAGPAFASVLLALQVVPFDVHHLTLVERTEHGFVEESWSWMQRRWRPERTVVSIDGGCDVLDRVTVDPRFAVSFLVRPLVAAIFRARHRALRARFGTAA